jgi:hypothetical protein
MKDIREGEQVSDTQKSLSEWLERSWKHTIRQGHRVWRPEEVIYYAFSKSARALGIQLRDPSDLAIIAIATKLSRMVESPEREDSYLDLIGYAAILGRSTDFLHQKIGMTLSLTRNHNKQSILRLLQISLGTK